MDKVTLCRSFIALPPMVGNHGLVMRSPLKGVGAELQSVEAKLATVLVQAIYLFGV